MKITVEDLMDKLQRLVKDQPAMKKAVVTFGKTTNFSKYNTTYICDVGKYITQDGTYEVNLIEHL